MDKIACLTLDLEPDHAGYAPEKYNCWNKVKLGTLFQLLKKNKVKLSVFVVTKSLKKNPGIINKFQDNGSEFHLHSHSHNMKKPDSQNEISLGKKVFKKYFGYNPIGFRAPGGLISKQGLENLKNDGFRFDASIIPSFWPKPSFFFKPNRPYLDKETDLSEIPFSTVSPMRFPITLSFIKLLGWDFYKFLFNVFGLPNPLIFSFHLHDLWNSSNQKSLPISWKARYFRNKDKGLLFLENFLIYFQSKGYTFITMNKLVTRIQK